MKAILPLIFLVGTIAAPSPASAQTKTSRSSSALCTRGNALQTIRQQIDFTRTFDDQVRRITVLLRAADMIWPYQHATMSTPGFNPENGFREIARYDFDGTMYLAGTFANKPLRALTTLALIEDCLKGAPEKPEKVKPKKNLKSEIATGLRADSHPLYGPHSAFECVMLVVNRR